jgi:acyl-CoA synthetase (NDP forming)
VQVLVDGCRRSGRARLTEPESEAVLRAYGMPVATGVCVRARNRLGAAAYEVGYPLVAKIVSPDILHKVDAGGVMTGIDGLESLEKAYDTLLENARRFKPDADLRGVLLQATVRGGSEFLIGANRHPKYGVLMAFGLGGTLVEVLGDARFRRAPLTGADTREMIQGIRAAALLDGFRGRPPRDVAALQDCLLRLSWLMEDFPAIAEVDLNPVFALEHGARIADARMILGA